MDKERSDYIDNFAVNHEAVFHYMYMLGYTDVEIKTAISWFNIHHQLDVYSYQLPLAIGMLVKIIEKGYCYYETY